VKASIGTVIEAAVALFFYHYNFFPMLPAFIPFILNLALFALAMGVAVTGLIFRYTTKFQTMAWSVAGLLMPLSCVFYPLKSLPHFLQRVAWVLPTTHSFEGMRQVIEQGVFSASHFKWGVELNVIYFILAALFFRWMFESARARGLLVKLD
jgi:ABC-2 type transport system permease protein